MKNDKRPMTNPQRKWGIGDLSLVVCHFSFVILGNSIEKETALPNNVDVRCSFFVDRAVDGTVRAVDCGGWSMVRLRLPMLLSRGRLPIARGSFIRNSEDFRNLDGLYHNPIIGIMAQEV
jgi:hypothetical protein